MLRNLIVPFQLMWIVTQYPTAIMKSRSFKKVHLNTPLHDNRSLPFATKCGQNKMDNLSNHLNLRNGS